MAKLGRPPLNPHQKFRRKNKNYLNAYNILMYHFKRGNITEEEFKIKYFKLQTKHRRLEKRKKHFRKKFID